MSEKFGVTVKQTGEVYSARVVRRRTSRGTTVEREQGGFPDHAAAVAWGEAALAQYLAGRQDRNARRRAAKARRRKHDAWLDQQTLQKLAELSALDHEALSLLKWRADLLWQEIAFRALKRGETEAAALDLANRVIGKNWTQRLAKALRGDLDHAHEATTDMAVANAVRLVRIAQDQRDDPRS